MAIKMVRKPTDTPNINNIDDIVGLRYAYGNQNGYVIAKGTEVSHSVNGSTFKINSGRLVLQGVEVDIDANGLDLQVDNIATKQYYSVYLTVNLALNTVQIQFTVDTAGYPEITAGDDLTKNTSGIARLELYRFTAQNGVISEVSKLVQPIKYIEDRKVAEAFLSDNSKKINNIEITQDENGVLKVGEIIIPQKKLIWSGSKRVVLDGPVVPTIFDLTEQCNAVEIVTDDGHKIKVDLTQNNVSVRYFYDLDVVSGSSSYAYLEELWIETSSDRTKLYISGIKTNLKTTNTMLDGSYLATIRKIYKIIE